jgi:phosphoribosylformylglycinamidine synthase
MAFAGDIGADITTLGPADLADEVRLFSESATRFVIEVRPDDVAALRECLGTDVPLVELGQTTKEPRLRIAGAGGEWLVWVPLDQLKEAWQKPLRW